MDFHPLHRVYLGMGTNLGNREGNIQAAITALLPLTQGNLVISPVYDTPPMGPQPQNSYLNLCISFLTFHEPLTLLKHCKALEIHLGRTQQVKWGPREIDLDILLFDSLNISLPELQIPHPGLTQRAFVLQPLCDIAPEVCVPQFNKTVKILWQEYCTQHNFIAMLPHPFQPQIHAAIT